MLEVETQLGPGGSDELLKLKIYQQMVMLKFLR
jgi:hypothetical protein